MHIYRYPLNRNQIRYHINLNLNPQIQYTGMWIAGLCWAPIYYLPGNGVMSYLRLLALSLLTCIPNMSFLAQLFSDNFKGLKKFELGALSSPATPKEKICMGFELPFIATYTSYFTFLLLN